MKLDLVHDIQSSYRKVLKSMSEPGVISNLNEESLKVDIDIKCRKSTFLMMLMLLDREVSFNVVSNNSSDVSTMVSQMTYSKLKSIDEADYIFVLEDANEEELQNIISKAKIGDLVNPNKSATIISEFKSITYKNNSNQIEIALQGPGIKDKNVVNISGNRDWIREREIKNEEYPLGVDLIYIDSNDNLICIPRTTRTIEGEV